MASVPDTTTFTFQNVKSVVAGSPNSLAQAFTNSTDAYFDPAYKGSKNSLYNFRNYTTTASNTLTVSPLVIEDTEGDAGVYFFTITSNATWVATKDSGGAWLGNPSPSVGSGDDVVAMTVTANTTGSTRYGTFKITTFGGSPSITRYVSITQHPRD